MACNAVLDLYTMRATEDPGCVLFGYMARRPARFGL